MYLVGCGSSVVGVPLLKTWASSFNPHCQYLSDETLKAVIPFYLVSMPGEVKEPTQGVNVQPVVDSTF